MALELLEKLASKSNAVATKAVVDAQRELCNKLDAKLKEIEGFRSQVASQTKQLTQLVADCRIQQRKLSKPQIAEYSHRAQELQSQIEQLNQKMLVIEESERIRKAYN